MKKLSAVILVVLAIGLVSACKSREKCPAYGKNMPTKQQPSARS